MTESLYLKYRPKTFEDVIGQDAVVTSLRRVLKSKSNHTFLFSGPSGTGKTTLARILATEVGAKDHAIQEIDAATFTSIDDMRRITETLGYKMHGRSQARVIIVDECFAPGTLIDVGNGFLPIEQIGVGQEIVCGLGLSRVSSVFRSKIPLARVMQISIGSSSICCSKEHLFFTARGWVAACDLQIGDELQSKKTLDQNLLLMWDKFSSQSAKQNNLHHLPAKAVPGLWGAFLCAFKWFGNSDLFESLWRRVGGIKKNWAASRLLERSCFSWGFGISYSFPGVLQKAGPFVFQTDAEKQPHKTTGCNRQNYSYQNKKWDELNSSGKSGWEWKTNEAPGYVTKAFELCGRVCCFFGEKVTRIPYKLQSGFGFSAYKISNRSRWERAQFGTKSSEGSQKGKETGIFRVDSVTSYQRAGIEILPASCNRDQALCDGYVTFYDLEIEKHPSYFVNNVLVHNCHRLGAPAWASLLKSLEEPPPDTWWCLCTTELGKIPTNIKTRCTAYNLKDVPTNLIIDLLESVAVAEKILQTGAGRQIVSLCAKEAHGSPRAGLVALGACAGAKTIEEARDLLRSAEESTEAVDLARALVAGRPWGEIRDILVGLKEKDVNPESIRHVVRGYVTSVIMGTKGEPKGSLFAVLEAFAQPFAQGDGISPLVLACGTLVLGG